MCRSFELDNFFKSCVLNQSRGEAFELQPSDVIEQLYKWMENLAREYGYFGVFLISLIGALSIIFPIPYTVVIFTLGGLQLEGAWVFEPVLIAIAASIGSASGEFSGYFLGFSGRKFIGEKFKKKMEFLMRVFDKFGPLAVFLFALTPLPDDLLFIPLGVMRYSIVKILVPALIGKFCMNLIVAYSGRFSIQIIRSIFGVESDWVSAVIGMVIAIVLLIIVLAIMFIVDLEKYFERYVTRKG